LEVSVEVTFITGAPDLSNREDEFFEHGVLEIWEGATHLPRPGDRVKLASESYSVRLVYWENQDEVRVWVAKCY
jgi:hypothetical protein